MRWEGAKSASHQAISRMGRSGCLCAARRSVASACDHAQTHPCLPAPPRPVRRRGRRQGFPRAARARVARAREEGCVPPSQPTSHAPHVPARPRTPRTSPPISHAPPCPATPRRGPLRHVENHAARAAAWGAAQSDHHHHHAQHARTLQKLRLEHLPRTCARVRRLLQAQVEAQPAGLWRGLSTRGTGARGLPEYPFMLGVGRAALTAPEH